ncbi:MAG TPA: hypothetical protein VGG04_03270 [Candidatus Sulfotelmatobacter sp.]|jgi:hypothetical protein
MKASMPAKTLLLLPLTLFALSCNSCSPKPTPQQQATPPAAQEAGKSSPASTSAVATPMLDHADQATIRNYLQTVQEVTPKKFSVQWSADTVPVSRDEAMRSLQNINEDGSLYTFASSEPVVAKLAPGRILWIYDIALRRIDSVANLGDLTLVHTKPIALTEALPQSDIEFDTPVNFAAGYGAMRPHLPKQPAPQKTSGMIHSPAYREAALTEGGSDDPKSKQQPDPENPPPPDPDEDDYGLVAATQNGYTGKIAGFEYSMQYKVSPNRLSYELQARKEEEKSGSPEGNETNRDEREEYFELMDEQRQAVHEEHLSYAQIAQLDQQIDAANKTLGISQGPATAQNPPGLGPNAPPPTASPTTARLYNDLKQYYNQKQNAIKEYEKSKKDAEEEEAKMKALASAGALAKQVFFIISDNLDVRFRSKVDLDRSAFSGNIQTAAGSLKQFGAHFKDMKGNIEFEVVARLGQPGNGAVSVPVVNLPVVMNIPVPVDGIPLVVQFAADFMVKLFLAGNHATHHFSTKFQFGGGAGLDSTSAGTTSEGNLSSSEPEVADKEAMSPGTSGLVVAVQLPRFGLGIGFMGASAMAYMDLVHVLTITNSAGVAALNPQCQRFTLDTVGSVGVDVAVMPIPFPLVQSVASHALSQRKEVWRRTPQWKVISPDIAMCRMSSSD